MKVGIDARPMLFSRTGIGRYVAELVRALGRIGAGDTLRLYGDAWRPILDRSRIQQLVSGSGARLSSARIPGRVTTLLGRLGFSVERRLGGVDLFHFTDLVFPPVRRARTVVTIQDLVFEIDPSFHGDRFRRTVSSRLRAVAGRADRVIVPSLETLRQVCERYHVPEERVSLIPHAVDHMLEAQGMPWDRLEPWATARGIRRPYLLCVGTLEPRKNHSRLLTAFERFSVGRPHMLVLVGGFGWLVDELRERLHRLAPLGRVVHLADLDDRLLPALYDHAELNVYPSLYEGFGLPVLEGMARGAPTVTTRRGAIPEVGGDAVRYCEAEDVESLEQALADLADSEGERARLARAGRKRARTFSWTESAREHLRVYEEVCRGRDGSAEVGTCSLRGS
ncbi:MAG: glycosyltransferase family 1 protein [Planctomycetota bacterium]